MINARHEKGKDCAICPKGCRIVHDDIQDLMNQGVFQVSNLIKKEKVAVVEPYFNFPDPVKITYQRMDTTQSTNHLSPVVICMPTHFPYESAKTVPWKYEIMVVDQELDEVEDKRSLEIDGADVTTIEGTSRMTRNGRIYTPEFNVTSQAPTKEATVTTPTKEPDVVQSEEAVEFLKIIKRNNYKVVDQLHQTLPKISILSLLLNSRAHRDDLLKVLAQAHVTKDITIDQFDRVVDNIQLIIP